VRIILVPILSVFISLQVFAQKQITQTETVILITIDGLRWQEVFSGVDPAFFDQTDFIAHKKHHTDFKEDFWRERANDRRRVLMPFFWNTIAAKGQLFGNREQGSIGSITNKFHFSYPGYSEILTGIADDRINSNDKISNPNRTILEWLNNMPENKGKVEAFGSWDVFPYIINEERSGVPVNAGFEAYEEKGDQIVALLNKLQQEIPSPWDTVGLDAFTFRFARKALQRKAMRFVYIAAGETDDFAHDGHYDQYIKAAQRTDKAIGELWKWLQGDERYKGKTTLLITTDHGRGKESLEAWKYHGRFPYTKEDGTQVISDFAGDDEIWMAAIGPDTPVLGEITGGEAVYLTQVAATAGHLLGYKYESDHPELEAGKPISRMLAQ